MKKIILAAALITSTPALAQTTSNGTASNNVWVQAYAGGGGYGGDGAAGGRYREDIHTHGDVMSGSAVNYAPSFSSANPCAVGMGGSASFGSVGASLSNMHESANCVRREEAKILWTMGYKGWAVRKMCKKRSEADDFYAVYNAACYGWQDNKRYAKAKNIVVTIIPPNGDIGQSLVRVITKKQFLAMGAN